MAIATEPEDRRAGSPKDFDGPLRKRSCTDVIFLILFVAFLGGLGYGIYYAVVRGNIERILIGYDSYGDICGRRNPQLTNITRSGKDLTKEPFLVFHLGPSLSNPVPDSVGLFNFGFRNRSCSSKCPDSAPTVFLQRCLPGNVTSDSVSSFFQTVGLSNFFDQVSMDIQICWKEIVYLCLIALGLSIVLTVMFRFLAGLVVWLLLIALILGSAAGTAYLWYTWYTMNQELNSMPNPTDQAHSEVRNMMIYAIILSIVTGVFFLIVLVMRKRVALVVRLFREAGKAVHSMPLLLIQPVWTLIAVCGLCVGWVWAALWIESSGNPQPDLNGFALFTKDTFLQVMRWYNVFAILWLTQFCFACQSLVVAGAVATWFFTRDKSRLGTPILTSTWRLVRYHLGSVALGSFIIALLKLIRLILSYVERQLRNRGLNNSICSFFIKCCQCCLLCFERFLKYLNSNAYIEIAIYGKNFCSSAQKAFGKLANNALRVAAVNSVGDFVLFLGKAGVVTSVVFIGIELLREKSGVNYIWVPILIAAIFAYVIAHCFISIYEMCIDSIFLCFCEDCEMNDGLEKPYFMSRGLMEFVDNSSKVLKAYDQRKRQHLPNRRPTRHNDNPAMIGGPNGAIWTTGEGNHYYPAKATAPPAS